MSKKNFVVQETSNAYGSGDTIPWDKAWTSEPMTLKQARSLKQKLDNEMSNRCGPNAWDSNRRIIAIRDVQMTAEFECEGPELLVDCPDHARQVISYTWPAGETQPYVWPEGWPGRHSCPKCDAKARAWERERYGI